ncbi:hypothetical protein CUMW_165630 [Citrus unshiu]|uniref:Uncharacterized protein n=1 Tax=Citrus unshiu TaxID=55188 RepID=A0A2H5PU74_CITUN|nr:hypothetical protein CUMW_165630 [Citrus unshiu]
MVSSWSPGGILGRAPTVGDTFKPVPQSRLKVPARTGRYMFSQQRRLPCDLNWGANSIKHLRGLHCQWSQHFVGNTLLLSTANPARRTASIPGAAKKVWREYGRRALLEDGGVEPEPPPGGTVDAEPPLEVEEVVGLWPGAADGLAPGLPSDSTSILSLWPAWQ